MATSSAVFAGEPGNVPYKETGTIASHYGTTAPTGWFECNGAAYNTTTYSDLFAVLGTATLPDLRGEFIRGLDSGRGVDTGRVRNTAQSGGSAGAGVFQFRGTTATNAGGDPNRIGSNSTGTMPLDGSWGAWQTTGRNDGGNRWRSIRNYTDGVAGSGTPRNIAFMYIIKY